jgi:hypothetical protein
MNGKPASIKSAVADFMMKHGIPGEMEQNLIKEAIHLHLLSALSDAGILRHVVFQGGTALCLCYGGERYTSCAERHRWMPRKNRCVAISASIWIRSD